MFSKNTYKKFTHLNSLPHRSNLTQDIFKYVGLLPNFFFIPKIISRNPNHVDKNIYCLIRRYIVGTNTLEKNSGISSTKMVVLDSAISAQEKQQVPPHPT